MLSAKEVAALAAKALDAKMGEDIPRCQTGRKT